MQWKKRSEETQTVRAGPGCSKAEPKKNSPPADPLHGARDGQNLTSWDGHYFYLQTQFCEDRCT